MKEEMNWPYMHYYAEMVKIFYRKELASLFQVQEKLKTCRNLAWNFSSSYLQMTVI